MSNEPAHDHPDERPDDRPTRLRSERVQETDPRLEETWGKGEPMEAPGSLAKPSPLEPPVPSPADLWPVTDLDEE